MDLIIQGKPRINKNIIKYVLCQKVVSYIEKEKVEQIRKKVMCVKVGCDFTWNIQRGPQE